MMNKGADDPMSPPEVGDAPIGVVAVGRNEAARLAACLDSVTGLDWPIIYVDSASSDESVTIARERGVTVVTLADQRKCTAARARNLGVAELRQRHPEVEYIQFVDADCVVLPGWLAAAYQRMKRDPTLAVVCGRRREIRPRRNLYHRAIDMEWDTPIGPATTCGGDALVRASAFREAGGFNSDLICGEEPELCYRLQKVGWKIERIGWDMTEHDVDMTSFRQWWRRRTRGGWAFAEGAMMYGGVGERSNTRATLSNAGWAVGLPVLAAGGAWPTGGLSLLLLAGYPLLALKMICEEVRAGRPAGDACVYAGACIAAKWPELQGQAAYFAGRMRGQAGRLIEYK